jgi:hypothetical protein
MAVSVITSHLSTCIETHYRWLFFVEGALTIFVAIGSIFVLPDFPESMSNASWLTHDERTLAQRRVIDNAVMEDDEPKHPSTAKDFNITGLVMALQDWKVWWLAFASGSMAIALSFNAYFPTLGATMGYNRTVTLLLCAPPWIFATAVTFFVSRCVFPTTAVTKLA